jgi:hypothetical protein
VQRPLLLSVTLYCPANVALPAALVFLQGFIGEFLLFGCGLVPNKIAGKGVFLGLAIIPIGFHAAWAV